VRLDALSTPCHQNVERFQEVDNITRWSPAPYTLGYVLRPSPAGSALPIITGQASIHADANGSVSSGTCELAFFSPTV